jgi:hypothetical protein
MKFEVTDKCGYTLAEGRIERDRANARAVVDAIERRIEIERMVRNSGLPRRMASAAQPVDFLHQRTHGLYAPMATRRPAPALSVAAIWIGAALAGLLLSVGMI